MEYVFSPTTSMLLAWAFLMFVAHYSYTRRRALKDNEEDVEKLASKNALKKSKNQAANAVASQQLTPPGPTPLPIIGNLHQLSKYDDNPYAGFTKLAEKYGAIFSLRMGGTKAFVVSSTDGLKEVLITKGAKFDGRPDFHRWNLYFDGDRQQSLALCDWSNLQKTRRAVIRSFLLMKSQSTNFDNLDAALINEMDFLRAELANSAGQPILAKIPVQWCAMNVFLKYMCDVKFEYTNVEFRKLVKDFDIIFEDINNGHPTDFLPWLSPFFNRRLMSIKKIAADIREFILHHVIKNQMYIDCPDKGRNVLEGLLANHKEAGDDQVSMDWTTLLFALEDLLGGSSSIGNLMLRVMTFVANNPDVQNKLQKEVDEAVGPHAPVSINHRKDMPYTEATIMEVLRHTSSPIVPHVANEDTTLGDYRVDKGTVVFINNYALNMSEEFWDQPTAFKPERFLKDGQVYKPAHFLPFSTGKRACVGSRILMHVCFVTLANITQYFEISIPQNEKVILPPGKIAVIGDGFNMVLNSRT